MNMIINLLLIIVTLLAPGSLQRSSSSKKKSQVKRAEKTNADRLKVLKKQAMNSSDCIGLMVEELSSQCASYKLSPSCFVQTYGSIGLEFGEEDTLKEKQFIECLKTSGILY